MFFKCILLLALLFGQVLSKDLLRPENFLGFGPLCDDVKYLSCHSKVKTNYQVCTNSNSNCQCYYIGVVLSECIKYCPAYNPETFGLLEKLCKQNPYELSMTEFVNNNSSTTINTLSEVDHLEDFLDPSRDIFTREDLELERDDLDSIKPPHPHPYANSNLHQLQGHHYSYYRDGSDKVPAQTNLHSNAKTGNIYDILENVYNNSNTIGINDVDYDYDFDDINEANNSNSTSRTAFNRIKVIGETETKTETETNNNNNNNTKNDSNKLLVINNSVVITCLFISLIFQIV